MNTLSRIHLCTGLRVARSHVVIAFIVSFGCIATGAQGAADHWIWEADGRPIAGTDRSFECAVWTGSEMLLWGGQRNQNGTWLSDGFACNPLSKSWRGLATSGAPSPRYLPTAIWTGREMIIWGGQVAGSGGDMGANTGSRYNPVTDTWRPTRVAGAPARRLGHVAVWTGSEMVIWGGHSDVGDLNTGGRYDPTTDTWRPTSLVNAPGSRSDAVAVWTGSEMIVWGGYRLLCEDFSCRNEYAGAVGRYNPQTDSWITKTFSNAPAARASAAAVWDGQEMIVWGGYRGNSYGSRTLLNTGGRFNPQTESWRRMSTSNAPAARDGHGAWWTGSEMLVWGATTVRAVGGRYNPMTDSWVRGASNGSPTYLDGAEAVWTGEALLAFDYSMSFYYEPGLYAMDGLPNAWQQMFFGETNSWASPAADPDGDGQNNLFEYMANGVPTNAMSRFRLEIAGDSALDNQIQVTFYPVAAGRTYLLTEGSNLAPALFWPSSGFATNDSNGRRSIVLSTPDRKTTFFRAGISLP